MSIYLHCRSLRHSGPDYLPNRRPLGAFDPPRAHVDLEFSPDSKWVAVKRADSQTRAAALWQLARERDIMSKVSTCCDRGAVHPINLNFVNPRSFCKKNDYESSYSSSGTSLTIFPATCARPSAEGAPSLKMLSLF